MRKILKNNTLYFLLVLILVSLFYYYPKIVLKRPESVHKWRQSDCTSLALNYYQNGMNFFQPQTHNFTSDNDTSGYCATSEIPFVYYFVAILYKIFGIINLCIQIRIASRPAVALAGALCVICLYINS